VEEFGDYSLKLFNYLAELEQRLFSEVREILPLSV
jgi:hypothetical protein